MEGKNLTSQPTELSGLGGGHVAHLAVLLEKPPVLGHERRMNGVFALIHGL